jgi:hypothetical protein
MIFGVLSSSATFQFLVSSTTPLILSMQNVVTVEVHNFIEFSPYSATTDEQLREFTTFGQIQADNVA